MENIDIGKKIKEFCKTKGLTIKKVAEASEILSSMWSQLNGV